jgi:DNA-binding SARP family transcriptional activator/DNA-binding XRE family transcriptional regulator
MAPQNAEATVGSLLRRYRLAAGLSQQELATGAAVSVRTIRDIEHERVDTPRAPSLRRLAEALGLAGFDRDRLLAALPGPRPEPDTDRRLRVEVLGPLSVRTGAAAVDLGPAPQRDLLALLALQPGRVVSRDEIVDVLWGDEPPKTCLSMVQTYVGRLRARLDPDREPRSPGVIRLAGDGYAIDLGASELDLAQFQDLVERGNGTHDAPAAVDLLDRALRCWRGPVLAGASPRLRSHPAAVAAARRRVRAALAYADLAADLGLHEATVARLQELAPDEPLHEGLAAKLMVALAGSGERAAALSLFAEVSRRLSDELGVEPSAELRDTHLRILRQEQVVRRADPRPRQLPAAVPGFTGRAAHLERLDALLPREGSSQGTAVVISAIDGTAGVGKTALAVYWAHRVADRFPDGQLYVNLRGFDPAGPVPPDEAVRGFLDALHVPGQRMPVGLDAQAALYRSLLAGRRMLVVLDNARDADQVRPLLPGSSGCLVIVTSRNELAGLVAAEGAHPVPLDLLDPEDAAQLLARRLGADRVAAEPEALASIVRACAGLPLALVIVAARAATRPGLSLAALAAELRQARGGLDAFSGTDPVTDVRAVFSWSYRSLSEPAGRLFRLLGLHPGADLTMRAAASLAGVPAEEVRPLLAELSRARLMAEHAPGRYAFHDLLRAYAAELAAETDPPEERHAALHRLLDHYLHTAYAADAQLNPHRDQITRTPSQPGVTLDEVSNQRHALAWFAAEHATLLAVIERTVTAGCDTHTWQLAWAVTTYLDRQGHWHDWAGVQELALMARRGQHPPQPRVHVWGAGPPAGRPLPRAHGARPVPEWRPPGRRGERAQQRRLVPRAERRVPGGAGVLRAGPRAAAGDRPPAGRRGDAGQHRVRAPPPRPPARGGGELPAGAGDVSGGGRPVARGGHAHPPRRRASGGGGSRAGPPRVAAGAGVAGRTRPTRGGRGPRQAGRAGGLSGRQHRSRGADGGCSVIERETLSGRCAPGSGRSARTPRRRCSPHRPERRRRRAGP